MSNISDKVNNGVSVIDYFDQIVDTFGSCDAIQNYPNNRTISYKELQQQAISIANQLHLLIYGTNSVEKIGAGVVLCVEEGPELVVMVMALAYAGLFYVPVELNKTPPQRVAFIANDCGSKICIGWKCDVDRIPKNMRFICVEDILHEEVPSTSTFQYKLITSSTPLYAIYTSGSTGEPKGVMMNHGNLAIYSKMKGSDENISKTDNSRVLLASAFTFDLCQGDIYTTLLNGGILVTAHRSVLLTDLRKVLTDTKSTHITLTPSLFGLLDANELVVASSSSTNMSSHNGTTIMSDERDSRGKVVKGPLGLPYLKSVCLGGEPMSSKMIQIWGTNPSKHQLTLRNLYGATEATVHQTRAVIYPDSRCNDIGVPIGYSYVSNNCKGDCKDDSDVAMGLNRVGVFLACDWTSSESSVTLGNPSNSFTIIPPPSSVNNDDDDERITSCAGEIVIFGPTVANSYLNRVEMSSHKFPVTERFGRVFRTGDLGQWVVTTRTSSLERKVKAHFELIGRMEEGMVKVNGQRVEVGEVASTLEFSEVVQKAIVLKLSRGSSEEGDEGESVVGDNLVALLVLVESEILDEHTVSALMALCELTLPPHMVPRRFGYFEKESQFPLTHSGKVDQRKLMQHVQDVINHKATIHEEEEECDSSHGLHMFSHAVREIPQSDLEKCVAGVWEEVLGLEVGSVGRFDNFTALGGDSLAALRASRTLALRTRNAANSKCNQNQVSVKDVDSKQSVQVNDRSVVEAVVGDEQGLVDGEAALYIHGGRVVNEDGGGEACMFGITMGPLAPCELENHSVLLDYALFLSKHGISPLLLTNSESVTREMMVDSKDEQQHTTPTLRALCSGVSLGRVSLVKTLLRVETEKMSSKEDNVCMFTPLHIASSSTHINATLIMKLITESSLGHKWAQTSTDAGTTALHLCSARGGVVGQEMVSLLLRTGANVMSVDADKCTALHLACRIGDHKIVDMLLRNCEMENKQSVDSVECEGETSPQHQKCTEKSKQQLLSCLDRWGRSALQWSILNNHKRVFQVLSSHGADTSSCSLSEMFNDDNQEVDDNVSTVGHISEEEEEETRNKVNKRSQNGSSDPAHVSRKLSSDIDTLIVLISIIKKYKHSFDFTEINNMETAVCSIRNLVCTSNLNRESARKYGLIIELIHVINRYTRELSSSSLLRRLTIASVGVLRNLSYGNENNRVAIIDAGGVEVLMKLLPKKQSLEEFQEKGEVRNLTFITASALCNIAMSSLSHIHILSTPEALTIIELVLGLPSDLITAETKGGGVSNIDTATTVPNEVSVPFRPHPGLIRLRDTFNNGKNTATPSSSRYSNHRSKKDESITESLKSLLDIMERCSIRDDLTSKGKDAEEEGGGGGGGTVNVTTYQELETALQDFITLVKSNNKNRTISRELGAIPSLLKQLSRQDQSMIDGSSSRTVLLKQVEAVGCLSYGNDQNRLEIVTQGGVAVLVNILKQVCEEESGEEHSPTSYQFKLKFSTTSALCNLAMCDEARQQILYFPLILTVIERLVDDHCFSHPALARMYAASTI